MLDKLLPTILSIIERYGVKPIVTGMFGYLIWDLSATGVVDGWIAVCGLVALSLGFFFARYVEKKEK